MGKKNISQLQKLKLEQANADQVLTDVLKLSQKRFKKFDEIILHLYAGETINPYYLRDGRITKIYACFSSLKSNKNETVRQKFKDLLIHIEKSSLIKKEYSLIHGLFNAVKFSTHWLNPVEHWKPSTRNAEKQFKELVEYLFCRYEIPGFLVKGFFEHTNMLYINWLIHLGNGGRVKDLSMPIPFTQKMGHHFLQAPSSFTVEEAIRWGQTLGLGGDKQLANRIAHSWLGHKPYGDEEMWEQFIRLVVAGSGMFNCNKVTELIDYVREAKRIDAAYHLKGRTLQSLMRQSDDWHNRFSAIKGMQVWKPCGLESYKVKLNEDFILFEELTDSKQLAEEGNVMKHCVASYAWYCDKGKTAIFSMRKYLGGVKMDIMATIEVDLSLRRVVQAKAKANKAISNEAKKHLTAWAERQLVSVSPIL
jgi:hypothetical protein